MPVGEPTHRTKLTTRSGSALGGAGVLAPEGVALSHGFHGRPISTLTASSAGPVRGPTWGGGICKISTVIEVADATIPAARGGQARETAPE